jgi:hypothetical protein
VTRSPRMTMRGAIEQDRRALELLEIGHAAPGDAGARSIEISSSRPSSRHWLASSRPSR